MNFLTDEQVPKPFVDMLRKLEWDVVTVYELGTHQEKNDEQHLISARDQGRVFITLDQLTGEECARVAAELILNGGKIIEILGGPGQPFMRALGRLLFHHPDWYPFLDKNDGIAKIRDVKNDCKLLSPQEYSQMVSRTARHHFDEYIKTWEEKAQQPPQKRRRKQPPDEQTSLSQSV